MKRKMRFLGGILAAIMFVTACQKTQVVDESVSGLKEDEVALVNAMREIPWPESQIQGIIYMEEIHRSW